MFIYGKTSANAIAVMSFLAENSNRRVGSFEIAQARGISKVLTAKLLTQLALAELVVGQPGPRGGYTMAKPADEITLLDVISVFENTASISMCPFGRNWCGQGKACPLHDQIAHILDINRKFLEETSLSVFRKNSEFAASPQFQNAIP